MSKRIKIILVGITEFTTAFALLFAGIIFYQVYEKQIYEDLKLMASLIEEMNYLEVVENNSGNLPGKNLRISIISEDGVVIYDNHVLKEQMDNHKDREEIIETIAVGEGSGHRKSKTIGSRSYYYAKKMEDGNIIRIAKEVSTIGHIFYQFCPLIICLVLILVIICLVVAQYFTKKLLEPINHMANHLEDNHLGIYPELLPFMNRIRTQHADILKSARMRQDFTANVSHELKTPLTSISGYSELIESGMATDDDIQHFAKEIHKNSTRLLTLINDIIRLSELDATDGQGSFELLNLYELTKTCVESLQLNAEKHGVTIDFMGEDCKINGSREMVEELVYNLCDNAIRYNKVNGEVHVTVGKKGKRVILAVSDTGIGIPREHQERIFERFYRVDKSRSKRTGGTGLGLAIVKHIVSQLDAEISLDSEFGKGTKIEVTF